MRYLILFLFLSGCASFESLVTKKEFEEYKNMNAFEQTNAESGILFNKEDIRKNKEAIKGIYKELDNLDTLYMQLDADMIDYLWHKDNVIQVR